MGPISLVHFFVFLVLNKFTVNCFNLDTNFPIIYVDPLNNSARNSYFGYSILLKPGDRNSESWLQISAPRGNGTILNPQEPGVVWNCPKLGPCRLYDFLKKATNGQQDYKGKFVTSWFGASMAISLKHDRLVVCGHRYEKERDSYSISVRKMNFAQGGCFWKNINEDYYHSQMLVPLRGEEYSSNIYYTAVGEAGMSSHFPKDVKLAELLIGAPGYGDWRGTVARYKDVNETYYPNRKRRYDPYYPTLYSEIHTFRDSLVPDTTQINKHKMYDLFGYSVSSGRFFDRELYYVGGAPRHNYIGKVFIFYLSTFNILYKQELEGSSTGEYFGASLAVADINGDDLDDLFVGAPHYFNKKDEGRVYLYMGNKNGKFDNPIPLSGSGAYGGQFGLAIQSLGDIDGDGITDIAIGAPYENNNRGAVYIYNGGKDGLNTQPSQIIRADDISPSLRGLGISFSNAEDIDQNRINDLAVGSYLSSHVVLLRTQPVVHIHVSAQPSVEKLDYLANQFEVKACYWFTGSKLPKTIIITCHVQVDKENRRAYIEDEKTGSKSDNAMSEIILKENQRECEIFTIKLKPNTTNQNDPISLTFSPTLAEKDHLDKKKILWIQENKPRPKDDFCMNCPITYKRLEPKITRIEVPYTLNCGDDEICNSDLIVKAKFNDLRLQIGAPRGNGTSGNLKEPGIIWKCPINGPCKLYDFLQKATNGNKNYDGIFEKSWFGVSMNLNSKHERVVVCGHHYEREKKTWVDYESNNDFAQGGCFWKNINDAYYQSEMLIPFPDQIDARYVGYKFGSALAGMSSHFPKNVKLTELLIGAPGYFYWTGTIVLYRDVNPYYNTIQEFNQITNVSMGQSNNNFGYSVSSGRFFDKKLYYVGGAPNTSYKGKVFIFYPIDKNSKYKQELEGSSLGEYFGATLAAADINNDNLDDLFVGAPHFSNKKDEGRVYLFMGNKNGKFDTFGAQILTGSGSYGGQFGLAIQSLGDIDDDGFGDVAIGAPYENENRGAVYIYNGGKDGLNTQPSQIIKAEDISPSLKGFGISFSNAADVDKNEIKDLAVGAYLSSHVVLLRTQPIVHIHVSARPLVEKLDHKSTEFIVQACYGFTGLNLPSIIQITCKVQVDKENGRGFLEAESIGEISLKKNESVCKNYTIKLKSNINMDAGPITVAFSLRLANKNYLNTRKILWVQGTKFNDKDEFCKNCPITYKRLEPVTTIIEVPYNLNCGNDEVCESDLMVQAKFSELSSDVFVIGSKEILTLNISVENTKEPAYLTNLEIILPENVYFAETPPFCKNENKIMTCRLGNIMIQTKKPSTILKIDMKYVDNPSTLNFHINVSSRSLDENPKDNVVDLSLKSVTEATIEITGNGGKIHSYSDTNDTIEFQQQYEVIKTGRSPLEFFNMDIFIPKTIKKSGGVINFLKIYEPSGYQSGQSLSCTSEEKYMYENNLIENENSENLEIINNDPKNGTERRKRSIVDQNENIENKLNVIIPPDNRTLFLNCSSNEIVCFKISCLIGPFKKNSNAILTLRMVLDLKSLEPLMGKKNIVFLSTDGHIKEKEGNRSDKTRISSSFIGNVKEEKIDTWIIIVACISGFLILFLITGGLVKAGFFKRADKDKLQALKEAEVRSCTISYLKFLAMGLGVNS